MISLKGIKIAFIDIDGVLSIPRYKDCIGNVRCAIGQNEGAWFNKSNWNSDCYKDCAVNPAVVALLDKLKRKGVMLYALTHETNSGSYFNKIDFVLNNYSDYFNSYRQILFVSKIEDKIRLMDIYCSKKGFGHKECLLVEDTYDTCIDANDKDYRVCHISELFLMDGEK